MSCIIAFSLILVSKKNPSISYKLVVTFSWLQLYFLSKRLVIHVQNVFEEFTKSCEQPQISFFTKRVYINVFECGRVTFRIEMILYLLITLNRKKIKLFEKVSHVPG